MWMIAIKNIVVWVKYIIKIRSDIKKDGALTSKALVHNYTCKYLYVIRLTKIERQVHWKTAKRWWITIRWFQTYRLTEY